MLFKWREVEITEYDEEQKIENVPKGKVLECMNKENYHNFPPTNQVKFPNPT